MCYLFGYERNQLLIFLFFFNRAWPEATPPFSVLTFLGVVRTILADTSFPSEIGKCHFCISSKSPTAKQQGKSQTRSGQTVTSRLPQNQGIQEKSGNCILNQGKYFQENQGNVQIFAFQFQIGNFLNTQLHMQLKVIVAKFTNSNFIKRVPTPPRNPKMS